MKIAYFTDTFLPKIDGVVSSLLAVSSSLVDQGHEVLIIAPKPSRSVKSAPTPLKKGIHVEYILSVPSLFYPDLRAGVPVSHKIIQSLRKFNPDVIHFQTTFLIGGGAILLGKLLRKPIVGSFHTYFMEPEYTKILGITDQRNVIRSLLWKYAQVFYNQCDEVMTPAALVKEDLLLHGITKPIHVIPNPINESNLHKIDSNEVKKLKAKYKLKNKVILYVGRVSKEKCLDVLIKSFNQVTQKMDNVSLLIIGDGPARKKLESQVSSLGLQDTVVFTGAIPHTELLKSGIFCVADVFASTSTSEVQPVSVIEAMAYGLPLVGVNKRGVNELMDGVGLVSESDDHTGIAKSIESILLDTTLQSQLSKKSITQFKNTYSTRIVSSQYEKYYKNLIKRFKAL